uniref:Serine/arginine repetitive matrix protein C-terminal domain-containing protein n=1 Tax=Esox lucius TaxID=8010 RepID=A0A6Q2ZIP9_ESOLU
NHQGEKQLFEKFWKGTFKAVAKPRPESVIVASITARRRVIRSVVSRTFTMECLPISPSATTQYCSKIFINRSVTVSCFSVSFDDDLSPRPHTPKGKKKKRKSQRKRKRKRSVDKRQRHSDGPCSGERQRERKREREALPSSEQEIDVFSVHHEGSCFNLSKTPLEVKQHPLSVCLQVLQSKPGGEVLNTTAVHHHTLTNQSKGPQDYDSGNDTSSPPSTKTGVSRSNISGENKVQAPASPEKHKFTDGDNASDSGNSVTSYASLCKPLHVDGLPAPIYNVISNSSSSRSRSRSSASSRRSRRYSRSQSRSSARSYSRSSSCSAGWRKKGSVDSVMSRGSYSRYSKDRIQERKRDPISCEKGLKHSSRKRSGKRCRRRSYSPMRKRRRDSPSHLEARRITSARKRPIPYFRPSPSSSSRSTSISSWSSIFTRSRSPSPSPGFFLSRSRSRSRRRSRSYSSCRSYSRSSSCNSTFGSRSRSRSYDSPDSYGKGKKRH